MPQSSSPTPFGASFEVVDAMAWLDAPAFGRRGPLGGERNLYADDVAKDTPPTARDLDAAARYYDALRVEDRDYAPFDIIDHESNLPWPHVDEAAYSRGLEFHADIVSGLSRRTGRPVVTYGMAPPASLVRSIQGRRAEWQAPFALAAYVLADLVPAVAPSFYTPYGSDDAAERAVMIDQWTTWLRHTVEDWRAVSDAPIMPFVWPRYHEGGRSPVALRPIHGDFWRAQVRTLRETCDGMILWGGFAYAEDGRWLGRDRWDEGAEWWRILGEELGDLPAFGGRSVGWSVQSPGTVDRWRDSAGGVELHVRGPAGARVALHRGRRDGPRLGELGLDAAGRAVLRTAPGQLATASEGETALLLVAAGREVARTRYRYAPGG